MTHEALIVVVPAMAEVLLLGLCVAVAVQLRRLGVGGVCQFTLAAIGVNAVSQGWELGIRLGRPAGVGWLLQACLCAMMLYIIYRLGGLLARLRVERCGCRVAGDTVLVEEGG